MTDSKNNDNDTFQSSLKFRSMMITRPSMLRHSQHHDTFISNFQEHTPGDQVSDRTTWNVKDEYLVEIPMHYFLQKQHLRVVGISSGVIADRIVAMLRKRSIYALFHAKKANLTAKTRDGMEFQINMFKSNDPTCVIIETQKLSGCSLSFQKIRSSVHGAAQGLPELSRPCAAFAVSSPATLADITFPPIDPEEQRQDTMCALNNCEHILNGVNVDANLLGLEMLQYLTDASSSFHRVAIFAAKAVLGGNSRYLGLSKKITTFLVNHVLGWSDNDDHVGLFLNSEHSAAFSYKVLCILSNALTLLEEHESKELKTILSSKSFPCDTLVAVLMKILREATIQPHEAFFAAKCLAVLMRESDRAHVKAIELDALNDLPMLSKIGDYRNQVASTSR